MLERIVKSALSYLYFIHTFLFHLSIQRLVLFLYLSHHQTVYSFSTSISFLILLVRYAFSSNTFVRIDSLITLLASS